MPKAEKSQTLIDLQKNNSLKKIIFVSVNGSKKALLVFLIQ